MQGPCLPPHPHPESPEGRGRECGPKGPLFSPFLPLVASSLGSGSGKWAQGLPSSCQLLQGSGPLWNSPSWLPECSRVCSWAPSYGIPFSLSHRPFRVSAPWRGPPRSEGSQGEGKVTQTQGKQIQGYMFRDGGRLHYVCKVAPNFPVKKVTFGALWECSLTHPHGQ